jgi:tetratricopeptide (TPR) repeat protein
MQHGGWRGRRLEIRGSYNRHFRDCPYPHVTHTRSLVIALAAVILAAACAPPEERVASYIAEAQRYFDEGDYQKARLEARNAVQLDPKNANARYVLALLAEQDADIPAMFNHLAMAIDSDPAHVEARLKLGSLYFLGQSWEQVDEQLDVLLELAPEDARVRLLLGRMLLQKDERAEGMAEIERALERDPNYTDAILMKAIAQSAESLDDGIATLDAGIARLPPLEGRQLRELRIVLLAQGRQAEAVEQALTGLARDFPDAEPYQLQLAQFYASQGRLDDAGRWLQQVARRDGADQQKQLNYVLFLATERGVDKAEAALEAFIKESPDSTRLRAALGELYETTGRIPEARAAYERVVERAPRSEDGIAAQQRLAVLDLRAGETAAASRRIGDLLAIAPDDATSLLMRAGILFTEGRYDEVIADLRSVLRKTPEDHRALMLLAQTYVQKREPTLAKDAYRRLLAVQSDSSEGLVQLAGLHAADREFEEAEALLRRRVAARPDDILASGRLVEVLMLQNKSVEAQQAARRMAALANEAGVGEFALGRVLAQQGDFDAAAEAFRRSVAERAGDPLPLEGLVRSLLAAGKQQEAIDTLRGQLDAGERESLFARYLLGGLYGQAGNQADAVRYLEEVIRARPDAVPAYISLASVYGNDREARLAVYRRGLQVMPGHPQLSLLTGSELEQAGDFGGALTVYEELVRRHPGFEPGVNNLAAILLDHRSDQASLARALELAERLKGSGDLAAQDTVGWAYYRAGRYGEAVSTLERVVARADLPVFHYHLGMAYLAAGNEVGARQHLEKAVRGPGDYPGLDEARVALQRLEPAG